MVRSDAMRILGLFSKYFILLMLIEGLIVTVIDSKYYLKNGMDKMSKKAKHIGMITIVLSIVLFAVRTFM
jgi:hypothetical protein